MVAIVPPDVQKQQPACRFCLCLKPDIHDGGANSRLDHYQSQHLSELRYDPAGGAHASAIPVQPSARFYTSSFPMSDCLDTADSSPHAWANALSGRIRVSMWQIAWQPLMMLTKQVRSLSWGVYNTFFCVSSSC